MKDELKKHGRFTQRKHHRVIETKVADNEFKQDNTFNGFISSIGFAVVVATLLVSIGKMVSYYYFIYTLLIIFILLAVLMGLDYHRSVTLHGLFAYIEHLIETRQSKVLPPTVEIAHRKITPAERISPLYGECSSANFKRMAKSHWHVAKKIQKLSSSEKDLNRNDRLAIRKPKIREVIETIKGKSPMLLRKRLTKSDCSDLSVVKRTQDSNSSARGRSTTAMVLSSVQKSNADEITGDVKNPEALN